jgi:Protein of unknown function (DUF2877)
MTPAWDVIDAVATTAVRPRVVPIARAGILARAICRGGGRAEVAAVFDRSLYVRIGDEFLCIGEPAIGKGPLTLIAAARVSSLGLYRGQAASVAEQRIVIGDLRFDLDQCDTWRPPRWPVPTVRPADIGAAIAHRAATESPPDGLAFALFAADPTPLARIARPRIARFESWLSKKMRDSSCPATENRHPEVRAQRASKDDRPGPSPFEGRLRRPPQGDGSLSQAVASLIGLGPGLTPSGDDFLIGALAAFHALGQTNIHATLAQAIIAAVPTRTSPLSACFLRAAAAGHVGESLYAAVASVLAGNVDDAVAGARRIGHTSGWDMLAGVAVTLRIVTSGRAD